MRKYMDYIEISKKLYGKELEDELTYRRQVRKLRITQRIGVEKRARQCNITGTDVLAWEYGYACCPHEEWEDSSDFHFRFVFQTCKKCRMVKNESMEKVNDSNVDRAFEIYKKVVSKTSEKDNDGLVEK